MDKIYRFKKVMVVDDTKVDRLIASRMIAAHDFAESVITKEGAQEALDYLKDNPDDLPDIIFLDINMPLMNGFEFLEEYNHLPEIVKRKSIVFLSSSLNESDLKRAAQSPYVIKFINKPLNGESLKQL